MNRRFPVKTCHSAVIGSVVAALVFVTTGPAFTEQNIDAGADFNQDGDLNSSIGLIDRSRDTDEAASPVVGATGEWISYPVARRVGAEEDPNRGWCRGCGGS